MSKTESLCRTIRTERIASWAAKPWRSSSRFSTVSSSNRLSNRLTPTNAQTWDYDAVGNWDSITTNSTTQTRGANRQNEITSVSGATTPTYDSNGNLTKDENDNRFVWDAWNMLVQVKNSSNVVIITYGRDALHRHVTDTVGSSVTDRFFSTDWQVLETKAGSNTVTRNVWSPAYVDAMVLRDRDTDSNGTLDERLYPLQDANWNTTALVNTSGSVVERDTYSPFGVVTFRDASGSVINASTKDWVFLHQGGQTDSIGNYDFRNRIYSPTLGRWLTNDPLGFAAGDPGWYRANKNNPIIMFDPSGLWSFGGAFGGMVTGGGVGAGVGATVGAPLFGIGALPGAIGGGVIGGIGGFIAGGVLTEPAYSAISGDPHPQLSVVEEVGMGMVLGVPVGVVGGIAGSVGLALTNGAFWTSSTAYYLGLTAPGATMTVSHWGKPGIYPGSWVMVGKPDWLSWILAGGPQIGPYSSGLPYKVPVHSVVTPIGGEFPWYEWIKIWQKTIK